MFRRDRKHRFTSSTLTKVVTRTLKQCSHRRLNRRRGLTLVEVFIAIVLLCSTSLILLQLMQDYARVVQRSEFEALAATRCESALALLVASRNPSAFTQLIDQLSDDQMSMQVQIQETSSDKLRWVSVTAQPKQPSVVAPITVSRLIYLETS